MFLRSVATFVRVFSQRCERGRNSRKKKRPVDGIKTTRRFVQNNPSFLVKRPVVFSKTSRRFFELHIVLIFSV